MLRNNNTDVYFMWYGTHISLLFPLAFARFYPPTCREDFFSNIPREKGPSLQNDQCSRINQFYTYSENYTLMHMQIMNYFMWFMLSMVDVIPSHRVITLMSRHVLMKSADQAVCRIWNAFLVFWHTYMYFLNPRKFIGVNGCLDIICRLQLPWRQGYPRTRLMDSFRGAPMPF